MEPVENAFETENDSEFTTHLELVEHVAEAVNEAIATAVQHSELGTLVTMIASTVKTKDQQRTGPLLGTLRPLPPEGANRAARGDLWQLVVLVIDQLAKAALSGEGDFFLRLPDRSLSIANPGPGEIFGELEVRGHTWNFEIAAPPSMRSAVSTCSYLFDNEDGEPEALRAHRRLCDAIAEMSVADAFASELFRPHTKPVDPTPDSGASGG